MATVIIFDTDHLNPYGRELALQLSETIKVTYIGSAAAEWKPPSPDFSYPLRTSADGTSRVTVLVSTFLNVLHTSLRVLKGDLLIVLWPRTLVESVPFSLLAAATRRVWLVLHNPRPRSGQSKKIVVNQTLLRRHCRLLIHSGRLLGAMTEADRTRTSIVAHPPYLNYLDRHGPVTLNPARDKLNVLFLGQLRADKSPSDLVQVLQELREAQARLIACGKGSLGDLRLRLEQAHVEVDDRTSAMGVTDEVIIRAISASHVLCAPYKEATQSGSIIMAITAGLPVVAYDSGALSDLSEWITLVPVGDAQAMARELAKRRGRQDDDAQEHIQRVEKWSRDAVASWVEAVQA